MVCNEIRKSVSNVESQYKVCNKIRKSDLYCHYKVNTKVCNEIKKSGLKY
jgi:hypothetical protein